MKLGYGYLHETQRETEWSGINDGWNGSTTPMRESHITFFFQFNVPRLWIEGRWDNSQVHGTVKFSNGHISGNGIQVYGQAHWTARASMADPSNVLDSTHDSCSTDATWSTDMHIKSLTNNSPLTPRSVYCSITTYISHSTLLLDCISEN